MSTRAKTKPGTTPGSFAPEHRSEVDADLLAPAASNVITTFTPGWDTSRPGGLVKPVTCRKCGGDGGFTYVSGADGVCAPCSGTGEVEGSREAKAANKARREAIRAFYNDASDHSRGAVAAFQHLREHAPERWEKALASHGTGHPELMTGLDAHWEELTRAEREERRRLNPPKEHTGEWQSFDELPEVYQEAIRARGEAERPVQWQAARVPREIMTERIMAAHPDLAAAHGDFETYHDRYVAERDLIDPDVPYSPLFESEPGSGLYLDADGILQVHSYLERGAKAFPLLRSREPEQDGAAPDTTRP